jgi:hypothetical protein
MTPNLGFNPGFTPTPYAGVNSGLNPGFGVLRCGPCTVYLTVIFTTIVEELKSYWLNRYRI